MTHRVAFSLLFCTTIMSMAACVTSSLDLGLTIEGVTVTRDVASLRFIRWSEDDHAGKLATFGWHHCDGVRHFKSDWEETDGTRNQVAAYVTIHDQGCRLQTEDLNENFKSMARKMGETASLVTVTELLAGDTNNGQEGRVYLLEHEKEGSLVAWSSHLRGRIPRILTSREHLGAGAPLRIAHGNEVASDGGSSIYSRSFHHVTIVMTFEHVRPNAELLKAYLSRYPIERCAARE